MRLTTVANPADEKRSVIGVLVEPAADIRLPLDVSIDAGNIGGPSAGLAFALDVMEKLGRDVDGGRKVAATGELSLDGCVHTIGGIKQKTIGARAAGVDVFLVPPRKCRRGEGARGWAEDRAGDAPSRRPCRRSRSSPQRRRSPE